MGGAHQARLCEALSSCGALGSRASLARPVWEPRVAAIGAPWAGLPSLVARGDAVAAFPLHDEGRRAALAEAAKDGVHTVWSRSYGRFAERDLARYFGSSVAFYFCWLSHYASWLRYLAAAGLALVGVVACAPAGAVVAFARLGAATFMAVWCALLCRSWHAREGRLALRWGTLAAAKLRGVRPRATRAAFRGAAGALDPVTGKELWVHDPDVDRAVGVKACCDVVNRGVAVYDGKVYVGVIDGRLEALDAKTGDRIWSTVTVDQSKPYTITGAPRFGSCFLLTRIMSRHSTTSGWSLRSALMAACVLAVFA